MINIEINIKYRSAVYGFGIRPVSRLRGTSLSKIFSFKNDTGISLYRLGFG